MWQILLDRIKILKRRIKPRNCVLPFMRCPAIALLLDLGFSLFSIFIWSSKICHIHLLCNSLGYLWGNIQNVTLKLLPSEPITKHENASSNHDAARYLNISYFYLLLIIICVFRYRPPDVLLGSKDYTTSLDIW
jgi:hypothetical protein